MTREGFLVGKVRMSVTLDEEVVRKVQTLAEEDSRNTSQMINKILRDLLLRSGKGEGTKL